MKYTNVIVLVIIVAAVLVAAYAVGLLVRQGHTEDAQPQVVVGEPNDKADAETKMAIEKQLPGARRAQSPESSAQVQEKREQALKTKSNMTEEERRQVIEKQVKNRFSASGKGRNRDLPPEEREKAMQRWQSLSEEEKQALRANEARRPRQRPDGQQGNPSEVPQREGATREPGEPEPNQPDQG